MKIFPSEPEVDLYKEGFEENDILNRKSVGKSLSDLVERIDDPMVVALDGGWGTGKTYFLKRWVGAHTLDEARSATMVYFDAFANDYVSDPLPALVSALGDRFPEEKEGVVKQVKAAVLKLAKPAARIGLAIATCGATEVASAVGGAAIDATSKEFSHALGKYWAQEDGRREAMAEFRTALKELVSQEPSAQKAEKADAAPSAQGKLVIVIDELDRCRPDYALETLEVIKHFFDIPGVIFVLGVNLKALENSVMARYGANIDASAYLRKFIHVTFSMPRESVGQYGPCSDILNYFDFQVSQMALSEHIAAPMREQIEIVSRNNQISLRDVGKILSATSLLASSLLTGEKSNEVWVAVAVTLVVSKIARPDLYPKFLSAEIDRKSLEEYFGIRPFLGRVLDGHERADGLGSDYCPQFYIWFFISMNDRLADENVDIYSSINLRLGHRGGVYARSIPAMVNRDWIDLFKMT
ncbi:MAG: KAP family NTPase [Neomegalonema sp.]|nr:KAP family NTPase [Neomegalonema sp.]